MTFATDTSYRSSALTLYTKWKRESERANIIYSWSHYADAIESELERIERSPEAAHFARLFEAIQECVEDYGSPVVADVGD